MSRPRSERPRGEPPPSSDRPGAEARSSPVAWRRAVLLIVLGSASPLRPRSRRGTGGLWFGRGRTRELAFRLWGSIAGTSIPTPQRPVAPPLRTYFLVQLLQFARARRRTFVSLADSRAVRDPRPSPCARAGMPRHDRDRDRDDRPRGPARGPPGGPPRGPVAAVLVALALAIDPIHVRYSLVPSPDLLVTLFVELGILAALDVRDRGRPRRLRRAQGCGWGSGSRLLSPGASRDPHDRAPDRRR